MRVYILYNFNNFQLILLDFPDVTNISFAKGNHYASFLSMFRYFTSFFHLIALAGTSRTKSNNSGDVAQLPDLRIFLHFHN